MYRFMSFFMLALVSAVPMLQGGEMADSKGTVVIMLGPPGSGKGTQAVQLSEQFKLPHISTGDLFRHHKKHDTELGRKAAAYSEAGELVPDALVIDMLGERVAQPDCDAGYILDGFPRTLNQAVAFGKEILGSHELVVLNLDVEYDVVTERLGGRLTCTQCGHPFHKLFNKPVREGICDECGGALTQRKDDTEDVIRNRLRVYDTQTKPLIQYYQDLGVLNSVDAGKDKQSIFTELTGTIKAARRVSNHG